MSQPPYSPYRGQPDDAWPDRQPPYADHGQSPDDGFHPSRVTASPVMPRQVYPGHDDAGHQGGGYGYPRQVLPPEPYPGRQQYQAYPEQGYPEQGYPEPYPQQVYGDQSYGAQPHAAQSYPDQSYADQSYAAQPYAAQSYAVQPYAGQSYAGPAQPGRVEPYPGQGYGPPGYPDQVHPGQVHPDQFGQAYAGQGYAYPPEQYSGPAYPGQAVYYPPAESGGYDQTHMYASGVVPGFGGPSYPDAQTSMMPQLAAAPAGWGLPTHPPYGTPEALQHAEQFPLPTPRRGATASAVFGMLVLFLVLCLGAAAAVYVATREAPPVAAGPTAPPGRGPQQTAPSPAPSVPPSTPAVSLVEPATLGGRPKVTDGPFAATVRQLRATLANVPGSTKSISALYGTVAQRNIVVMAAVQAPLTNPPADVDAGFLSVSANGLPMAKVATVPAGPLGGAAKCGVGTSAGVPVVMCGWADAASSGWFLWYFAPREQAQAEFVTLRSQVEKQPG